jgi:hypothetical protein
LKSYVTDTMLYAFSLPTKADKVPAGSDWIHEIKYDGYRMMLIREQDHVRLISRGGRDWAQRFPLIVAAALKLRQKSFVPDGEVVILDKDGVSDSTHWPRASTTSELSSMPSTCLPATARITAGGRSSCARQASLGCSSARSTASSSPNTSKATLATFYSASPATCGSRALFRSASIVPMAPGGASIGLR